MKPEKAKEKVAELSEELKNVTAEIFKNTDSLMSTDRVMSAAYDTGSYDLDDYNGWMNNQFYLSAKNKKLTKQREKLVKKLTRIIARHKLVVDDETADLLK